MSRSVRRLLVGALIWAGADELVGLLVGHRVDGLLDGFPDQLAQFVFHGLLVERCDGFGHGPPSSMIDLDTQIIPTARGMSFLFWACLAFKVRKEFYDT